MYRTVIIILSYLFLCSCASLTKNNSVIDRNLIIPGRSAEGYNIGERITDNSSETVLKDKKEIGGIVDLDCFSDLKFNSFIYNNTSVIFLNERVVIAIAGLMIEKRITSDAVQLSKGIDNFILNYGNSGLKIIRKENHKVYLYKESGIALFNDNDDNTIDMYLIFKKSQSSPLSYPSR